MSGYSSYTESSQARQNIRFSEDTDERLSSTYNLSWRLLLVIVFTIGLMLLDYFTRPNIDTTGINYRPSTVEHGATLIRSGLKLAVTPFEAVAAAPTQLGSWLDDITTSRNSLQSTTDTLTAQNLLLSAKIQRLEAIENENRTLRELLNASENSSHEVLIAEIVAIASDPFRQQIQINKGLRDNIYIGQPLIDSNGVIGQITRVDPLTSWAILISDSDHAIPVEITRNGLRTIARGTGDTNKLLLPFLPLDADVRPNDELRTSGLGGVFPAGYPVGTIRTIGRDISGKFAEVYATPSAALDRQRQLLLLMPTVDDMTMPTLAETLLLNSPNTRAAAVAEILAPQIEMTIESANSSANSRSN